MTQKDNYMKSVFTVMFASACLVISQMVFAHPGHDHTHWLSSFIHLVTVLAIGSLIVGGVVYKQYFRRRQNSEKKGLKNDA